MILNVSGRTDIVAFYMEWFMTRLHQGFVYVRNPYYPKQVSQINFSNVDAIIFCTKNPIPLLKYANEISIPYIVHITLTPYKQDIEPNVYNKRKIIQAIHQLSKQIGPDKIYIRYDPIFISPKYSLEYHFKAFQKLCSKLATATNHIIISFIDNYQNVRNNAQQLNIKPFTDYDYQQIGIHFSQIARQHGMTVQTCAENRNLTEYGFIKQDCVTPTMIWKLTGKIYNQKWTARGHKECGCVQMVDIGAYNSCKHLCKYCYANYNEKQVDINVQTHNPKSPLLLGWLGPNDIIKERMK